MDSKNPKLKFGDDDSTKFERRLISIAIGLMVLTLVLSGVLGS